MSKHNSNHSSPRRKQLVILALVAAYFLCVVFGVFLIWAISSFKNREDLLEISVNKGNQVLSAGQIDEVMIYGMEHWLLNEEGRLVSHQAAFLHSSQEQEIRELYSKVLDKEELFIPHFFLLDNREEDPIRVFGLVAGTVVESSGGHRFASILLRDLPDLDTTMITYVALFSIVYLVGVLFTVFTVRKERELNRMRRDLIANVSHELKTPITSIRAMTEVLHDGMLKDQQAKHEFSAKIIKETDRLEQLVLDILELSKLQSNRAEFHKIPVYADGLFPPFIDRYMMLCGDLGITLDTSGMVLTGYLYTDIEKIGVLISTLLDNAVKFTGSGGTIWVSSQLSAKAMTVCIRDNGPGIASEDVPHIFDRFYKADTAHNSNGSGLGLAIAAEIAKGLGEQLWVESQLGKGTAFYFTVSCK